MCFLCERKSLIQDTCVPRGMAPRAYSQLAFYIQLGAHIIGLIEAQKSDEGQTFRRRPGSGSMIPTRWAVGRLSHEQKHAHADICSRKKDDSAAAAAGQGPQIKTVRQSCIEDLMAVVPRNVSRAPPGDARKQRITQAILVDTLAILRLGVPRHMEHCACCALTVVSPSTNELVSITRL